MSGIFRPLSSSSNSLFRLSASPLSSCCLSEPQTQPNPTPIDSLLAEKLHGPKPWARVPAIGRESSHAMVNLAESHHMPRAQQAETHLSTNPTVNSHHWPRQQPRKPRAMVVLHLSTLSHTLFTIYLSFPTYSAPQSHSLSMVVTTSD